jgi:phosphoribosylamine--glycine ligase
LTIVGPEGPLSLGVVDAVRELGFKVFGPTRAAAQLETSKAFAKEFMQRHGIPTARYALCKTQAELEEAVELFHPPIVVKADGLHAGKGVIICESRKTAMEAAQGIFSGELLGATERQVIVEEHLVGEEISFLCLSDGTYVKPLVPAQDHKRIGEGDTGPNTGGMGVYSTDTMLDAGMQEWVLRHIAMPAVRGMEQEGVPFEGVLYCGLMMTARGPQVLEFNVRFGDPEIQAIVMRLESDLVEVLEACTERRLREVELKWAPGASVCVVASSSGYPGSYQSGFPISGLKAVGQIPGVEVFHAGTAAVGGQIVTAGGRVLGVSAAAETLERALELAYQGMSEIEFEGIYYRHDIGHRAARRP